MRDEVNAGGRRYAVNLSILFPEVPLLQRPAAAREAGFTAVEFWWPFPEAVPADRDVDAFVRAVQDARISPSPAGRPPGSAARCSSNR
jgi:hydroxypyruvate isomerase